MIDSIHDSTFHYKFVAEDMVGVANWRMEFQWHALNSQVGGAKPHPWAPHATPVMAGGLFAVGKEWFQKLGRYDEGS